MLVLTSCGCSSSSSSSILSLPSLNRKHLHCHPHGFCPPLPSTLFSVQNSVFYAIHCCQCFLPIDSHGGSGKRPVRFSRGNIPVEPSSGEKEEDEEENGSVKAKTSGTSARGRRLLRVREEKRKREYDRIHNYPTWAKILENACKDDEELRAVLGDSVGNPELMRKRVEERVRKKGKNFRKSKTGSVLAFKVSFRE